MSAETKPANPPAFPVLEEYCQFNDELGRYEEHYAPHGGMTLRDYFAAKAMQGIIAKSEIEDIFDDEVSRRS